MSKDSSIEADESSEGVEFAEELVNPPKEEKAQRIDTRELKDAAAERAKNRPLLARIIAAIRGEKELLGTDH